MNLLLNVQKNFPGFQLAADVTLTGDRVGVFGSSGSGKSTLVSMLAGFLKPDAGEIVLDDETLFSSSRKINVRSEQRRIAMVFQQHALFPHLNVRNNLLYGYSRCKAAHRSIHLDDIVPVLQLDELLDRNIGKLSGGQQQRVALGRAILANPRLLLMDEPLSALDDSLRFQIIPYLRSVSEQFGIPYLFISHSLVEMRLMTDSALVFEKGVMVEQVSSEQLARNRMGQSQVGYINLLRLGRSLPSAGLFAYPWGAGQLLLSVGSERDDSMAELSSKDIILFKQHPEAISARNLLQCSVRSLFNSGRKVGVELECDGNSLIAEVVQDAVNELSITPGCTIYAAIKASAFRMLPS
ncbi:MAG: molybdenum ABC transporter ATP-binding protein [Geobacteraceae bacterium GWC2_55_20]|nr:MAG: molybdenum ABC transporter ATP-binding protein [Geobacteraceae bacterium GWC2_55_20]OGU25564.1 MAG: molybdenum ABC transporter ATP-binding protein [Geobacteraceae bacterium GWF2_54_21]HCE68327.1 molybdenum ABC transporter ATP-binding protein [Geobacter sp.]